ncbi:MAG: hypothetical protein PHC91_08740 [Eubacteriales bacterium]|nr:hypothetical protein [Eubacteriales bacterium]
MTAVLSYFIATISILALFALWFINAYQVISSKKQDLIQAEDQVRLHREGYHQQSGSPDEQAAMRMLETSKTIYLRIENSFHETLQKPFYRIPGFLMGFRKEENNREKKEGDR